MKETENWELREALEENSQLIEAQSKFSTDQAANYLYARISITDARAKPDDSAVTAMRKMVQAAQTFDLVEAVGQFGGTEGTFAGMKNWRSLVTKKFVNLKAKEGGMSGLMAAQWIMNNANDSLVKACFDINTAAECVKYYGQGLKRASLLGKH